MGIKGNTEIFGDGVIYEGVSDIPQQYRGQTGAQDDIIPTLDIFTGVINNYPNNELTKYLLELREYRPKCVQEFFSDLHREIPEILKEIYNSTDLLKILLAIIEQIYYFRNGHFQFVQKYIMKNTKYNIATGGTPITKWIPNQIQAVLKTMYQIIEKIGLEPDEKYMKIYDGYYEKYNILQKQIKEMNNENYDIERIIKIDS